MIPFIYYKLIHAISWNSNTYFLFTLLKFVPIVFCNFSFLLLICYRSRLATSYMRVTKIMKILFHAKINKVEVEPTTIFLSSKICETILDVFRKITEVFFRVPNHKHGSINQNTYSDKYRIPSFFSLHIIVG